MKLQVIVALLAVIALGVGCDQNKKKETASLATPSVLDVPAAPAAQYTPPAPQQPVVYDAPQPQEAAAEESYADASDTIAPAPQRQVARKPAASGTKYKVKKGESLWSIAQARYGDGNKWKRIAAANPRIDPNKVQAGQTIVLP